MIHVVDDQRVEELKKELRQARNAMLDARYRNDALVECLEAMAQVAKRIATTGGWEALEDKARRLREIAE